MCVIPDHEIVEAVENCRIGISPFSERCLTPNGYDLRIAEISVGGKVTEIGVAKIPPRSIFFVSTVEFVSLPDQVCAQLWLRTTFIRKGIMAGLGKVDAGFQGTLTFTAFNMSDEEIEINIGDRFVQMVLERLHTPAKMTYEKRSGHYQGQKGITLKPLNDA
jgi:dCTP deaminase